MKREAAVTRQRILTEATAEFAQHGIAGARVDRIAAASGSNKSMIYAYFTSKDQLFDAVFDAIVVRNTLDVPIDANNLPEYAARLSDQYERYSEVERLITWDRLERDGKGVGLPVVMAANQHKIEQVARAQRAGLVGDHLPAAQLLTLIFAIAQTRFKPIGESQASPDPEQRREAIRAAVSRLIRP